MTKAKDGNTVQVHYTGKLNDGSIFDSSIDREPIEFNLGEGKVIPGFEQAVQGMELNEKKTFKITPEDAYGIYHEDKILQVPANQIPDNIDLEVGQHLQITQTDGQELTVVVKEKDHETVTLDANHPLAGQELTYEIELVSID